MFKRHYIDEIEYPPSPICSGNPQFELNITSFQFLPKTSRLSVLAGITPSMTCILYTGNLIMIWYLENQE